MTTAALLPIGIGIGIIAAIAALGLVLAIRVKRAEHQANTTPRFGTEDTQPIPIVRVLDTDPDDNTTPRSPYRHRKTTQTGEELR